MTDYPNFARQITDLRKRGDIEGAIAAFKQSPEEDRRHIAVRSAMAWCLYDRDIKPCNDPEIEVTSLFNESGSANLVVRLKEAISSVWPTCTKSKN
jgi:hypothetical protein